MSLPVGASDAVRVGGGDINDAWRVTLTDGQPAFVKSRRDASPGEYRREAASLRWLAEPGALRVPEVLDVSEGHLALEWIEQGSLSVSGAEELGRGLALTHAAGARCFGDPGLDLYPDRDGNGDGGGGGGQDRGGGKGCGGEKGAAAATIGSLSLPNEPLGDWPSFYVQRRLLPALRAAHERGGIDARGVAAVQDVCERIEDLSGPSEPPARLHGDLWSGNVLAGADGSPWLIDPTAYGGHREVDLAMLLLFGAPSQRVFDAYEEARPLADGWRERVGLWQLLPLLVHAALFGGGYGEQATRVAQRYAS